MSNSNEIFSLTTEISHHLREKQIFTNNSWKISNSNLGGRGIFATRDIEINEIIFCDSSLIVGPRINQNDRPICIVCYKNIKSLNEICRRGCSLPVCENCVENEKHFKECDIIRSWKPKFPNKISFSILKALTSIRSLILTEREQFLLKQLQGNENFNQMNEVTTIRDEFENFPENTTLMCHALNVLNTNAFEVIIDAEGESNVSLRGLYPLSSLMNHNCSPNTRNSFDKNKFMIITATRRIKMGEEIFTSYAQLLWGTPYRRAFLSKTKHFLCQCGRCSDPTEMGTFMAAVPCADESCRGKMIQRNSLSFIAPWSCDVCQTIKDNNSISRIQNIISSMIGGQMRGQSIENVLNYCRYTLPSLLPKFSQFTVEIKLFVIWKVSGGLKFKLEDYLDKEKYCVDILNLIEMLNLGECVKAGIIYFELYKCRKEIKKIQGIFYEQENDLWLLQNSWNILGESVSVPSELLRLKQMGIF